ncbi:MAG: double-strand break repair helicase AddA [Pararhizobium sp.]
MDDLDAVRDIIGQVAADQTRASDPKASAWVSANAGSGKTHVLTERVIRLLLEGNRPSAILCLTYTKAAAAEMANRVFERLAEWTRLDDADLSRQIARIEHRTPSPAMLGVARQLFARALETPGGLKIQTIHAFCESILHQFPLEANVAGYFEILDDAGAATLLGEARRLLLTDAADEADTALAAAFQHVLEAGGEFGLENLLSAIVANRAAIRRFTGWAENHGGVDHVLKRGLDLGKDDDEAAIAAAAWPLPSFPAEAVEAYCAAAEGQKAKKALAFAAALRAIAAAGPAERWERMRTVFLKEDGKPRSLSQVTPKDVVARMADAEDRVRAALDHVCAVCDRLARHRVFVASRAALVLARRLDHDYEVLKRERGRLDFDDLVARTAALLARGGAGRWVHYKLDQGIDHILVDEAQDTSPPQWSVIRALADDFFAGEGARPRRRTLFVVGDEKQSIYSFQGARPERFDAERRSVEQRVRAAGERFEPVRLTVSFRSTADVLGAVDRVFEVEENRRGLGHDAAAIVHETARIAHPGCVDVWNMIRKEPAAETDDWTAPFDAVLESAPPARLARRVAATLKQWIGRETITDRDGRRPMRPGDVLVLVRKRDAFVTALTRELKQRTDIPVAGADRLTLADHIAVKDLAAFGRVMLLPEDDLSLAAVLKSPLFGVSEDELYRIAGERGENESVFAHIARLAEGGEVRWVKVHAELARWLGIVDTIPVFEFFARLLAEGKGRQRFLARLGSEASDVLDEFLSFAEEFETTAGVPGLQAFLATLETDSPKIKREVEKSRDEVRIMTVHASKGLEAPVVFLVDPGGQAVHASHVPAMRMLPLDGHFGAVPPAVVWVPGAAWENRVTEALKEEIRRAGEEEYRRLLYVGMTRPADRLVVCGYQNAENPGHSFWQRMVSEALAAEGAGGEPWAYSADGEEWQGLRYRLTPAAEDAAPPEAKAVPANAEPPAALRSRLPAPERLPRPLAPSGASVLIDGEEPEPPKGSPLFAAAVSGGDALERGRIIHRFLEVLPRLAPEERPAAAERYLARACPGWSGADKDALLASVFAILDDPSFAPVFAEGSEAEVSLMGTIVVGGKERAVSGRIDRLAVTGGRVLIVDYKTNRPPHREPAAVPAAYKAQLAIYRAVLAPLYPEQTIEAALVFTEAPALVRLPSAELDVAFAALR